MASLPVIQPVDEVSESIIVSESYPVREARPVDEKPELRAAEEDDKKEMAPAAVEDVADKMNRVAAVFNASLSFSVDKPTGRTVIRVIKKKTDELIRQIPPEEALRLIHKMRDVMGMLLDIEI